MTTIEETLSWTATHFAVRCGGTCAVAHLPICGETARGVWTTTRPGEVDCRACLQKLAAQQPQQAR